MTFKIRLGIACVAVLLATAGRLDAATMGVSSVNIVGNELISFETGLGGVYSQSHLIQPALTEFRGNSFKDLNIVVQDGGTVPDIGERSLLLTHDFLLDTGIINAGPGATAANLQFSPGLINGTGPDLVMFELGIAPDDFIMQVNGIAVTYLGSSYNDMLIDEAYGIDAYSHDAGPTENITQLENDSYSTLFDSSQVLFGIAIDLDDFGVAPLGMVSTVHFGSVSEPNSIDPVLFMGIRAATVPEPTSSLACLALGTLALARPRRRS